MRLRNQYNGIQVVVPDEKAHRLVIDGTYQAVPNDEQPPEDIDTAPPEQASKRRSKPGPTSIAAALKQSAGPHWDTPAS